jgi:hypothetical protein
MRTQDLSSGLVSRNTDYTANSIAAQALPWSAQIAAATTALQTVANPTKPEVDAVSGRSSGLTNTVDNTLVKVGEGIGTGNYLKAISGLNKAINTPFATATSWYQAGKVNDAIKAFTAQNGDMLHDMNSSMAIAEKNMNQIAEQANDFAPSGSKARAIMDQKRNLGSDVMAQIDDAIANNTDPDTAGKLQAMKNDWSNWLASRDQRVNAEQPEVNQMDAQASAMNQQAKVDASTFSNASTMAQKLIDSGGTDPNTAYSQHMTGSAQNLAQQVQKALIYSRAQFQSTLK